MIRPATRSPKPGEKTTTSTPTKNMTASTMIVVRRPMASEIFPPSRAPTAAAKTSELMARPNCKSVSPSSACIGPSAPLDTPVS